ncbi:MAG: zonular occludens toxin domain-containing protein [Zoogloeaceae bacterium]|jgi:hypothetical protein|nr:zonular occludens toxin domain-containing protein [Zoogloeaceae bacterium]
MITCITGLPGNGKTLYALNWVKEKSEKENRPVYYNGISDLKLPWLEFDKPEDWPTLPTGAIIVIDECQRVFRPRANGAHVPLHVSELETHRHKGVDIVLITQHPQLIDVNVRRLIGQHFHVVRKFGMARASIFEWGKVTDVTKATIKDATRYEFAYPQESFKWYKSAELHTHKRKLPMKFWFLIFLPFILAALIYYGYKTMHDVVIAPSVIGGKVSASAAGSSATGVIPSSRLSNVVSYFSNFQPRVSGLSHTAPAYDDVTKPVHAPYPAACVDFEGKGCRCYSQQGTRLDVGFNLCREIVAKGFFVNWDLKTESNLNSVQHQPVMTADVVTDSDYRRGALISAPPRSDLSQSSKK